MTLRIDEIEPIPVVDGELDWRPIGRTLGIEAFGINAYTANAGDDPDFDSIRDDPRFPN
jgi:hypothetical protein